MKSEDMKVFADEGFTGKIYIIKTLDKEPPYVLPLDKVTDTIAQIIEEQKLAEKTQEKAQEAYNKIKEGTITFEHAAKENNAKIIQTEYVSRNDYLENIGPSNDVWEIVFEDVNTTFSKPFAVNEGIVLVRVDGFEPIDVVIYAQEKESFKNEALSKKQSMALQIWFNEKSKKAEKLIDFRHI
jgi:transcription antitermination factor NusA-like protein